MWLLTEAIEKELLHSISKRLSTQLHIPEHIITNALTDESYRLPHPRLNAMFYNTSKKENIDEWQFKSIRIDDTKYLIHPSTGLIFKRDIHQVYYFVGYTTEEDELIEHTECPPYVLEWIHLQGISLYTPGEPFV